MGDTGNAMLSAIGIVMALLHRARSGNGQAVSTSIVNACLLNTSYAWIHDDGTPGTWDHVDREQFGLRPLYRMYPTRDGWVAIAVVRDTHRLALAGALGIDELPDDDLLAKVLEEWFVGHTSLGAFTALDDAGVPVEIVDELFCRTVFDDPTMVASGLIARTTAPGIGSFEDPGLLVGMSSSPGAAHRPN